MQSIGGNLSQGSDEYRNLNGKRYRGLCKTQLRAGGKDVIESLFSIPTKWLSIHAHVSKEKMGWFCLPFQYGQSSNLFWTQIRDKKICG